jgi:hypothetical protein
MLAAASCKALNQRTKPCIMASLCSLPAAQALQAGSIAAVLRCGINSRAWHRLLPVVELPNATQISTQCLCGLIRAAASIDAFQLVGVLCRYAWDITDTQLRVHVLEERRQPRST